jgi:signal transduction histidine kinase
VRRSILGRLLISITMVVVLAMAILGTGAYLVIRRQLQREFDLALATRLRSMAVLVSQTEDGIEIPFSRIRMQEFARTVQPEYYQVWSDDRQVLARSRHLVSADLPELHGSLAAPLYAAIVLPDGRLGRAAGIRFLPTVPGEFISRELASPDEEVEDDEESDAVDFSTRSFVTLVAARGTQDLDAALSRLWQLLLATGVTATLVIVGVLTWLVRRNLSSLSELAEQIEGVDDGSFTDRFQLASIPQELEPVVDTLNQLMERVQSTVAREKSFTSDVAHELRTPLAGIRSTLEVALSRPRTADSFRDSMNRCLRICNETQTIVETLLSLARIEAGEGSPRRELIDVESVLRKVWLHFADRSKQKEVLVSWDCDADLQLISDSDKLQVVLLNLFDNAVSYVDAGGWIRVGAEVRAGLVELQVANSGCELAEEQVERIFESFWRADESRSSTGLHAGLGLALCRKIMIVLGGQISVSVEDGVFAALVRFAVRDTMRSEPDPKTRSENGLLAGLSSTVK